MQEVDFVWSDAWLFASILFAGTKKIESLSPVIAYGDLIEHAIFNYEELDVGLRHLTQAGYITYTEGVLELTEKTTELKRHILGLKQRISYQKLQDRVAKHLGVSFQNELNYEKDSGMEPFLEKAVYEKAVQDYLKK